MTALRIIKIEFHVDMRTKTIAIANEHFKNSQNNVVAVICYIQRTGYI